MTMPGSKFYRSAWAAIMLVTVSVLVAGPARAQQEVKIGIGFGIAFLPVYLMDEFKLVEKHAKAANVAVKTSYSRFSGSGPMQDAVLSGVIDMGPYGMAALLIAWEKARGTPQQTFAVSGVTTLPLVLITNQPNIKKLADFKPTDRIVMPSLVSPQMFLLQMASEKEFGIGQHDRMRSQVVTLPHPESVSALVSGSTEVAAYFSPPPFTQAALKYPKVKRVLESPDVYGGKSSFLIMGATKKWIDANPKLLDPVAKAVDEAASIITNNPRMAAEIYLRREPIAGFDVDAIAAILQEYKDEFGSNVHGVRITAEFMGRLGQLKNPPKSWKDIVTPTMANSPSS
jgi:NitT/TauT family transport system substrate-binding protein